MALFSRLNGKFNIKIENFNQKTLESTFREALREF
jgi:hypothetical protein